MPEVLAGAVAVVALVLFRRYAARQVARRRGAFVWAFAFPMVLGPAVIVWAGARLLSSGQILGGPPPRLRGGAGNGRAALLPKGLTRGLDGRAWTGSQRGAH